MFRTTAPLKIALVLGHPRTDSFCAALADAYAEGARESRAEVRVLALGEFDFNPDVVHASPQVQPLEPDIARCRDALEWADHLVFVYPTWWATMPALLKGWLDRVLLSDFAFRVDEDAPTGYAPLLEGRSARLITTMDSPSWVYRWIYGRPGDRAMKGGILGFCGIKPVHSTWVSQVKHLSPWQRAGQIERIRNLGRRAPFHWNRLQQRRRCGAWFRIMRLQFYAMTLLGYGLGAVAVTRLTTVTFSWPIFLLGFVGLFLLEFASVLLNELHDRETDRLNRNAGPFTGGSRVLVEGRLPSERVRRAVPVVLGFSALGFTSLILLGVPDCFPWLASVLGLMVAGFLLGPGYTAPPLRLVYRGFGELTVAFTHSCFMVLCGWVFLGGPLLVPFPWLLSLPMFLGIFAAITLAGIPDTEADDAANKKTLAVRCSPRGASWIAMVSATVAAGSAVAIPQIRPQFGLAVIPIFLHATLLVRLLVRYVKSGAGCRRMDGVLFIALSFILWFSLVPMFRLLWSN